MLREILTSTFLKAALGLILILKPIEVRASGNDQGMTGLDEEEGGQFSQYVSVQKKKSTQEKRTFISLPEARESGQREIHSTAVILSRRADYIEILSENILKYIFSFLDIADLGRIAEVSSRWEKVTDNPELWRHMGSRYLANYLNRAELEEEPRKKVIHQYLSSLESLDLNIIIKFLNKEKEELRRKVTNSTGNWRHWNSSGRGYDESDGYWDYGYEGGVYINAKISSEIDACDKFLLILKQYKDPIDKERYVNLSAVRLSVEELTISKSPLKQFIGEYLKAFGLKYGGLGFERDRIKAAEYIKQHNVPINIK